MLINNLKYNQDGLIPVVTQSAFSGKVLMLAYANQEAIQSTLMSGFATYYSRSRQQLWVKGETSGNKQKIIEVRVDCDEDSLLYLVEEEGPACHTGKQTCFYRDINGEAKSLPDNLSVFSELYQKLLSRKKNLPEGSYVTSLFKRGSNRIIQKVGEEAVETVIAFKNSDKKELISEASDLVFHLLVALVEAGVDIKDIQEELIRRYK